MEIANVVLGYVEALAWPAVVLIAIVLYRDTFRHLMPGSTVKLTISGFGIETSLPVLEQSVTESLGGRRFTVEQLALLRKLKDQGRMALDRSSIDFARPLRNAGLMRFYPDGPGQYLQNADEIEITTLGRILIEAVEKKSA
jgi:hypothetical protein